MTTVVYSKKENVICYDTRLSGGGMIVSDDYEKKFVVGGATYVLSGCPSDFDEFFNHMQTGEPLSRELCVSGFMVSGGVVYDVMAVEDRVAVEVATESRAVGSGTPYASTALDMGATAKEAVRAAFKRDLYSGGKVKTLKIKN